MEHTHSTDNLITIADFHGVSRERITNVREIGNYLYWKLNGVDWDCKLTKPGLIKKNSFRLGR